MQASKNDNIQIALIGAGGMGQGDAQYSDEPPGVKLVAAADIYDSRLARIKEVYGSGVFTTRDYRETPRASRHRRRYHRHARPLARDNHQGCARRKKGRLLREADGEEDLGRP